MPAQHQPAPNSAAACAGNKRGLRQHSMPAAGRQQGGQRGRAGAEGVGAGARPAQAHRHAAGARGCVRAQGFGPEFRPKKGGKKTV